MSGARRWLAAAVVVGALTVAACSDADGGEDTDLTLPEVTESEGRPEVEPPGGPPPGGLEVEDLVEGDGDEVAEGATLTVHYIGWAWSGNEFASSWDRGQPLVYQHGEGRWVEGWTTGLEGMRAGGRRQIIVPPELGYGDRSVPGAPAGEPLVFVVDLLDVG